MLESWAAAKSRQDERLEIPRGPVPRPPPIDPSSPWAFAELGLRIAPDIERKLLDYVALIAKWNRIHNLTAVRAKSRRVAVASERCGS